MPSRDESHTHLAGEQLGRAQAVDLRRGTVLAGRYQIRRSWDRAGRGSFRFVRGCDRLLDEGVIGLTVSPDDGRLAFL